MTLRALGAAMIKSGMDSLSWELWGKDEAEEAMEAESAAKLRFEESMKERGLGRYAEGETTFKKPPASEVRRESLYVYRQALQAIGKGDITISDQEDWNDAAARGLIPPEVERAVNQHLLGFSMGRSPSIDDMLKAITPPEPGDGEKPPLTNSSFEDPVSSEGKGGASVIDGVVRELGNLKNAPGQAKRLGENAAEFVSPGFEQDTKMLGNIAQQAGGAVLNAGQSALSKLGQFGKDVGSTLGILKKLPEQVAGLMDSTRMGGSSGRGGVAEGEGEPPRAFENTGMLPPQAKALAMEILINFPQKSPERDAAVRKFIERYGQAAARRADLL